MRYGKKFLVTAVAALIVVGVAVAAHPMFKDVHPIRFDPVKTNLVQSAWIKGIGCPTNAKQTANGSTVSGHYTDPACATGDPSDKGNKGLLMAKTGPTANVAAAFAELKRAPSTVTEVGYDLRKPTGPLDPRGSHCGGGAPRFQYVTTSGATVFGPGCNNLPTATTIGNGWIRLRWTVSFTNVKHLYIAFDEGQDTGPDQFGLAVLDNIDVNGTLVGK